MTETQRFESTAPAELRARAAGLLKEGFRLVQIGAAKIGSDVELTYSFDRDYALTNLRLSVPCADAHVPSISGIYWCAFLYENEIHDLFNVTFEGLAVDFGGRLYQTRVKYPFAAPAPASVKTSAPKPASPPVAPVAVPPAPATKTALVH